MKKINRHSVKYQLREAVLLIGTALFVIALFGFNGQQNNSEKLMGISFNYEKKEITLQVVTTGCTVKNDFQFKVSNNTITIIRKKRDICKMMPEKASFTYTFAETGLSKDKSYTIVNSFMANPDLANIP